MKEVNIFRYFYSKIFRDFSHVFTGNLNNPKDIRAIQAFINGDPERLNELADFFAERMKSLMWVVVLFFQSYENFV